MCNVTKFHFVASDRWISVEAYEKVLICYRGENMNCPIHSRILSLKVPESVKLNSLFCISVKMILIVSWPCTTLGISDSHTVFSIHVCLVFCFVFFVCLFFKHIQAKKTCWCQMWEWMLALYVHYRWYSWSLHWHYGRNNNGNV